MSVFSTFGLFITLSLLMALVLALIVIVPWLRAGNSGQMMRSVDNQLIDLNVDVFKSRLQELATDLAAGRLNESQYETQKLELERQLLDAEQTAAPMQRPGIKSRLIIIIWVPLLAALAYYLVSDRSNVFTLWQAQDSVGQVADDLLTGKIDQPPAWAVKDGSALISAMQTNVYRHADDPNRWMRLSELFLSLEASDSALEALSRAYRLSPEDESIATTYAQISFFAKGGNLDANSRRVLQNVLIEHPDHEGAQMLMAMGEARAGNFEQAQGWIRKLRASIAQKPGDHDQALSSLDELSANIAAQQAQASAGVTVSVSINSSLLPLIKADDVLFVAIRSAAGGPPFAVKRLPVSQLDNGRISVTLSDLDAMMPERTLQAARQADEQLVVTARVSQSGNAMSQSGDLSANPIVLQKDQEQVNIEIAQQVP
ncbi:c-type cytochrome biogenesis protein CcmI [Psychrobacter pygoscelis]|uniref:c-type cytochrome biogenesis protein CcmI n=1 Tax=Psychrobacter pygoscelis TaxID=2488563 RepID=UPI00103A2B9F|nr:c-type cytochrome biogenesis protein CcmI [Psychrobacter pygoscelis]